MGRRCRPCPPPLAALAGLLVPLMCVVFFFHSGADARPLPAPLGLHHHVVGVKDAADDSVLLPEGAAGGNGDELPISEMVGEAEEACEEGNGDDECVQRRLLRDAHLDYIYTQHKGKP